jgi:hypothetical protein
VDPVLDGEFGGGLLILLLECCSLIPGNLLSSCAIVVVGWGLA